LVNERHYATENFQFFKDKNIKDLENLKKPKTFEEKNPKVIEEPKPGPNHLYCAVCKNQFKDFYTHIFSNEHAKCVNDHRNLDIFKEIDLAIQEVAFVQQ